MAASSDTAPPPVEGYPLGIFQQTNVDEKFLCTICDRIIRDPVQSFCGHRFCRACVHRVTSSGEERHCKKCLSEGSEEYSLLQMDQMFPDNAVRRDLSKIPVVCVNEGCGWSGIFKEYEEHFIVCDYRPVPCPVCGQQVSVAVLAEHKEKDCPARPVQCKFCKAEVTFRQLEEHHSVCLKFPVKCEYCGFEGSKKKKLTREKLQAHIDNECQKAVIDCPAGCGQKIEKTSLSAHMNSADHSNWIMAEVINLQRKVAELSVGTTGSVQFDQALSGVNDRMTTLERQLVDMINNMGSPSDMQVRQAVEMHSSEANEKINALEVKVGTFEGIVSSLHKELDKTITALEKVEEHRREMKDNLDRCVNTIKSLERTITVKDITIAEQDLRIQSLESASYDGSYIFKVTEFSKKHQAAVNGTCISIYSPAFYTSRRGYKMCTRLYPNGDGMGKGSNLSLFFVVMRGHYDALQRWPFRQRVTFCLINQNGGEHVIDSFRPDPNSSSFKRPTSDMNIASGCPLFIRLDSLTNPESGFLKDDTLFIKITVDITDLQEPVSKTGDRIHVSSISS